LKDNVAILKSGNQFTVVVDVNGKLHSFGKNLNGELGINSQQSNFPRSRSISNPSTFDVTQLSGAEGATVALSGN
jgi:alpha-tubulin suppressor-like RCC1 family protein